MDNNSLVQLYFVLLPAGFVITLLVTALYGFFAPWYRSDTGRAFFTLLAALTLLLLNSLVGIVFGRVEWRIIAGLIFFTLYCFAMLGIGVHIYKAQIHRFRRTKKVKANDGNTGIH